MILLWGEKAKDRIWNIRKSRWEMRDPLVDDVCVCCLLHCEMNWFNIIFKSND